MHCGSLVDSSRYETVVRWHSAHEVWHRYEIGVMLQLLTASPAIALSVTHRYI